MYVRANYFERILSSNRLNHISRKSISSTSQHHSNVQEVTQTDANDDEPTSSSCDEEEKATPNQEAQDSISIDDIPLGPYPSPLFYDEENNPSCTSSSSTCDSVVMVKKYRQK